MFVYTNVIRSDITVSLCIVVVVVMVMVWGVGDGCRRDGDGAGAGGCVIFSSICFRVVPTLWPFVLWYYWLLYC